MHLFLIIYNGNILTAFGYKQWIPEIYKYHIPVTMKWEQAG